MDITNRIRNAFKGLTTNSYPNNTGRDLARRFRKYGNDRMFSDWSQVVMDEADKYTGYMYAAINNRAKKVAMLGEDNLFTQANEKLMKAAKDKEQALEHPYIKLINDSESFTNWQFWYNISTFIDLKGRYYLLAVRNKSGDRYGSIQYFRLLNPYNIRRVVSESTRELEGYIEGKDGRTREIPKHMIIEIEPLNPYSEDDPYSMSDAASDSQFTLKTAGDHTRHSVAKNRATAGIVTVNDDELALDTERMANFKNRVTGKEKGEPIFGVGKGSISYNDMQIDLNKSALDKVSEVNLKQLIAVTGNSKTTFGIEESGVTRDTSENQKNMFINDHAVPQMKLILGALNQDYKNNYRTEYDKDGYVIKVNSPTLDDTESDLARQSIRKEQFALYQELRAKGYSHEVAAKYSEGEMELMEIDEPTEVKEPEAPPEPKKKEEAHNHFEAIHNLFEEEEQGVITQQQGALENAVINLEREATLMVMKKVTKNTYDEQSDIISKTDRKELEGELNNILLAFYLIIVPLFARRMMSRRANEFGKLSVFKTNTSVRKYIKDIASKTSQSHVNTILEDLRKAVQKSALEGATQQELINAITTEYQNISKNRAKAIARTETNRAFTQSQYQADVQFIQQNGYEGRAYKKWITRSDNPCPLCQEMALRPPVPFKEDFLDFGSELIVTYEDKGKTKVLKQKIDYERLEAGNLHTNCSCAYQLIIE